MTVRSEPAAPSVWEGRDFRIAWAGGLINDAGDWVLIVALPVYVFTETGSGTATALLFVCQLIIAAALGPLGGSLVDRWNLRRCLIATNLAQAVMLLPLFAVSSSQVWPVFVVITGQAALSQLNNPGQRGPAPAPGAPRPADGGQRRPIGQQQPCPARRLTARWGAGHRRRLARRRPDRHHQLPRRGGGDQVHHRRHHATGECRRDAPRRTRRTPGDAPVVGRCRRCSPSTGCRSSRKGRSSCCSSCSSSTGSVATERRSARSAAPWPSVPSSALW